MFRGQQDQVTDIINRLIRDVNGSVARKNEIQDSTITFTNNDVPIGSFSLNEGADKTIALSYPKIIVQSTDPGEGAPLPANHFIAYYEDNE